MNSSFKLFHKEIQFLINCFQHNNFPLNIIHHQIKSFLNKIDQPITKPQIVPKKRIYIKLPYYGYIFENIKQGIDNIIEKHFPHLDLKICFVNSFQIGSFFNHKDRLGMGMCSSIVYLFKCMEYNSKYVGSSVRQFNYRVAEHLNISVRSRLPISTPNYSAIMEHHTNTKHSFDSSNYTILNKSNKYNLRILQSLYIHRIKPSLNNNTPYDLNII